MFLNGSISANNFIQMPHPGSGTKSLGLTGRYLYLQVKAPVSSAPFSFHLDLTLADRSHGIRISASNLYKTISTQNGFSVQVPLNLDMNRWTVVVFDLYELIMVSGLLPPTYQIQNSYQIKQIMMCACSVVRGIYTSENQYDFVTLPPDMRFKFSFQLNKWPEQFAWLELPSDLKLGADAGELAIQRLEQVKSKAALAGENYKGGMSDQQKKKMDSEIHEMLDSRRQVPTDQVINSTFDSKKIINQNSYETQKFGTKYNEGNDLKSPNELMGFKKAKVHQGRLEQDDHEQTALNSTTMPYRTGQFIGEKLDRSPKLNLDPVVELKHVMGYSPDKCLNIKWSRFENENVIVLASGGTLIAMDIETNEQKKFFFGHSAPICCFDIVKIRKDIQILASAQEMTKTSVQSLNKPKRFIDDREVEQEQPHIVRIWDYSNARCISYITMPPVTQLKCIVFSVDGLYLACSGKDFHNKEMIIIWDISKVYSGGKPELFAKQTTEFNILSIKFSPVDNSRLVSCGKENIRFWRIKETGNKCAHLRGAAVVLNHHARNTVFTSLDFEWGAVAAANNQALQRVFVASKHGMVFQINYATEALEATYRTNDSAIYSISINEAFCVTGSDDQFIRVWTLDFAGFLMEAKHEGTVCSVEISPDALRAACGTLAGSLGILDKSNLRYRTMIRSHHNAILSIDFHVPKRYIITVALDNTIRLWDLNNYDQAVEFTSTVDQPLCVAAHPTLPIFSCGFQSGTMRVFDMDKLIFADEFTQFNKPVKKIAYSPNGDLLVTCSEDGAVSLHSVQRKHQPTKMMHLEFPPKFVHIAFSSIIQKMYKHNQSDLLSHIENEENRNYSNMDHDEYDDEEEQEDSVQQQSEYTEVVESFFGIMGEYGNNLMVYDSQSFYLKHQIQAGHILRSFEFTKNSMEVVMVTDDLKIKFYSLQKFEGLYLREISTVHRGSINSIDLSQNGGYLITGGDDNLIKVWDYDVQKTHPYYFQAFIGHTYPITDVMFNPCDNNQIISTAGKDGIYIWSFHGDIESNYFPEIEEEDAAAQMIQDVNQRNRLHEPTILEKMRVSVKEKKRPKLAEYSFIVPQFDNVDKLDAITMNLMAGADHIIKTSEITEFYNEKAHQDELAYNHFVTVQDHPDKKFSIIASNERAETRPTDFLAQVLPEKALEPMIINGYDGFSGVHDNLIWNVNLGYILYTLNNKLIKEDTKTRKQQSFCNSSVRLSCIAQSEDNKMVAVAEGETNPDHKSNIYIYDVEKNQLICTAQYHVAGVQSIKFACKSKYLVSVGVQQENTVVVWEIGRGRENKGEYQAKLVESFVVQSQHIGMSMNQLIVTQPESSIDEESDWFFYIVGTKGHFAAYKVDYSNYHEDGAVVLSQEIDTTRHADLIIADFVSVAFTQQIQDGKPLLLLGCGDGSLFAYNTVTDEFLNEGRKKPYMQGQIGHIICKKDHVVLADSTGLIAKFAVPKGGSVLPADGSKPVTIMKAESAVMSLVMDELNVEGILGTSQGNIFYINLDQSANQAQSQQIRLVSRASPALNKINVMKFDDPSQGSGMAGSTQTVFFTNCGENSGDVKLFTTQTLDQVLNWNFDPSPVRFICGMKSKSGGGSKKIRLVGHENGMLAFINLVQLTFDSVWKMNLDVENGEILTAGSFNSSGWNFVVGTSLGNVYLGNFMRDTQFRVNTDFVKLAKLSGTSLTKDEGVTSVQLTNFTPEGKLLIAFDNAKVRVWTSTQQQQDNNRPAIKQKGTKRREGQEISALSQQGTIQFNVIDKFDMLLNPHCDSISQSDDQIDMSYRVSLNLQFFQDKKYTLCEAVFAPGNSEQDFFISYVNVLQYIFVRNYHEKATLKKIALGYFPTCMQVINYQDVAKNLSLPYTGAGLQALVVVGTEEGKIIVQKVIGDKTTIIGKTKVGVAFGAISSVIVTNNGFNMIVSTDSGEMASYDLKESIKEKGE